MRNNLQPKFNQLIQFKEIAMFENREGQQIPQATFRTRRDHEWLDVTTDEVFKGRTVVVFALPGAFTPTCSSTHVPRYNQLAPEFQRHGVDEVICISVNDTFVMNEWQKEQKAHDIRFLPDGNGDFSRGMGMLVPKHDLGFGDRSWRYSMLVKDGVIEKMFIEPDRPGDPFEVSDADTMLAYIAPNAPLPLNATVFSREGCPYCVRAKGMLRDAGIRFEELVLNRDFSESTIRAISGRTTLPQVFVNGERIGGSEEVAAYLAGQEQAAA
jgi:glutaredoxin-like protein